MGGESTFRISIFNMLERRGTEPRIGTMENKPHLSLDFPRELVASIIPAELSPANFVPIINSATPERLRSSQFTLVVLDKSRKYSDHNTSSSFRFGQSSVSEKVLSSKDKKIGEPIFYCQLSKLNNDPQAVVLDTIDIHEDYRKKGIGGDFMGRLIVLLRDLGFTKIVALAENKVAGKFYHDLGFRQAKGAVRKNMSDQGIYDKDDPEEKNSAIMLNLEKN